jgi:zinc transporter ZupT
MYGVHDTDYIGLQVTALLQWDRLQSSFTALLLASAVIAVLGSIAGVWITGVREVSRKVVPFSGAVLLVLSLFWVMPELGEMFGWPTGPALMLFGFAVLWIIDRFVHPVCPACSHTHDHDSCSTRLHGFAPPLIAAAVIHTLFDGWTMAASHGEVFAAGVLIHKIPESIAYGVILQSALRSRKQALTWAILVQSFTLAGAWLERVLAPVIGWWWIGVLLAFGGGTFLYLGFHAVHGEWKRRTAQRPVRIG